MATDEGWNMKQISFDEAAALFAYDPETGVVSWKNDVGRWGHFKAGTQAGWSTPKGYLVVAIGRRKCYAHRIAWLLHYGTNASADIDHINGDKGDNRICNLRDVSRTVNKQNQSRAHKNSTTGVLGVSPYKGKYRARIVVNGKQKQIGTYESVDAAQTAYITAKRQLHEGCTL